MRPPFGARDWLVLDQVRKLGYTPVMWSVPLAKDWEEPPAQTIVDRILPYVRDGSIIVLHDGNRGIVCTTAHVAAKICDRHSEIEATRLIIERLRAQGYRFVTVPELLSLKGAMHMRAPGTE
jgi:peptidoglycan-N-acetylglucosamine deacetylase